MSQDDLYWNYRIPQSVKGKVNKIETSIVEKNDTISTQHIQYDDLGRGVYFSETDSRFYKACILEYTNSYVVISNNQNVDSKEIVFFNQSGNPIKKYAGVEMFSFNPDTLISGTYARLELYSYDVNGRVSRIMDYQDISKESCAFDVIFS